MKFDKDKWRKEQADKKEKVKQTLKDISTNFALDPTLMAEYIAFSSEFYNYSANNTKLIYFQNSYAQYVGSYQYFKDKGYNVKKGEKAMQIYVPVLTTLFTDGKGNTKQLREASKEEKIQIKEGKLKNTKKSTLK